MEQNLKREWWEEREHNTLCPSDQEIETGDKERFSSTAQVSLQGAIFSLLIFLMNTHFRQEKGTKKKKREREITKCMYHRISSH